MLTVPPFIERLQSISNVLKIDIASLFLDDDMKLFEADYRNNTISLYAGTGYVGLSLAVLLAQYKHVTAVDILPKKD